MSRHSFWCRDQKALLWAEVVSRHRFDVATLFGEIGVVTGPRQGWPFACRDQPGEHRRSTRDSAHLECACDQGAMHMTHSL